MARHPKWIFLECSAKLNWNINKIFEKVGVMVRESEKEKEKSKREGVGAKIDSLMMKVFFTPAVSCYSVTPGQSNGNETYPTFQISKSKFLNEYCVYRQFLV